MAKPCDYPGCNKPRFGGNYCSLRAHQLRRTDSQWLRRIAKEQENKKEPKKAIPKESKKQAARNRQYTKELPKWKEDNPICCFPDCGKQTNDCHHVIGKGIHTNNKNYMIPLCREHHDLCKMQSDLAFKLGLIETRTISRKNEY